MRGEYTRTLRLDDGLLSSYGGELVQAYVPANLLHELHARLPQLKRVNISAGEMVDLVMIGSGAHSPLTGFMDNQLYTSVLDSTTLPNALPWGLPVTLAVTDEQAQSLVKGQEIALYRYDDVVGVMHVTDIFLWDSDKEVRIFGESVEHKYPQIAARKARRAKFLLGGPVSLLATRSAEWQEKNHYWPHELRSLLVQNEWRNVAAIHVQNPWQRSDEYMLKSALEASDALFLHHRVETTQEQGSLLPTVLAGASRLLLENYFPRERLLENPTPDGLFSSSPRAALQHAILSQNYGCASIFLPVQDKLGGTEQDLLDVFADADKNGLTIRRVFLGSMFHCSLCSGIVTEKSCPHDPALRAIVSKEEIAARLLGGEYLPPTIARPEVARAVARGMADKTAHDEGSGNNLYPHVSEIGRELHEFLTGHKAGVLWMTGLSGSGKSTIAHRIEHDLILSGHRVYVLDGDTLRTGLNRDLGFSEEARRENLRRAAEVARVLIDAGLIVIAAFISPFRAERQMVREIVGVNFFEVYVEASIETCEERDPKGLYKRARAGVIPKFTGISSPYEAPDLPELRLNTSTHTLDECVIQFSEFIEQAGLMRVSKYERLNDKLTEKINNGMLKLEKKV